MNVVWLASWFPNRTNITNGDFIERHARAVAPFVDSLTIITAVKDESLPVNQVETEERSEGNITVHIIYYGRSRWPGVIEKFLSLKKYLSLQMQLFERIITKNSKPHLVHVHVAIKAGLLAKKIKQRYHIPYVITEHWTAYLKEANPNIYNVGSYFLKQAKTVLQNAELLITVSDELGKRINKDLMPVKYKVIPNVVDTSLFYPVANEGCDIVKLVHVSNMTFQKNMEAIVEALIIWKREGGKFKLDVFGENKEHIIKMVNQSGLQENVSFHGEVLQPQLCSAVQQADALLLYSRYETFGCVIIEANACGVPVIVSDLPVFHELVYEGENGVFVPPGNAEALAVALEKFAAGKKAFAKETIASKTIKRFGYPVVGEQIKKAYDEVLNA